MLSRRHIRIKVLQSLYSYFSKKEDDVSSSEKLLIDHIEKTRDLYFLILSLLFEVVKYAELFFEQGKKKHLPSYDDLNPNTRIINNSVIRTIYKDKDLLEILNNISYIWLENDHDIVAKVFKGLYNSDIYQSYINNNSLDFETDVRFIVKSLNECILNNKLVHHVLEEESIYWIDDLPFITTILIGNIKLESDLKPNSAFKDDSDKIFALDLFRGVVIDNKEYELFIMKFVKNWELERIAYIDRILLKMAFSEILTMEELPVKVSMNEYIEIAKYYSTSKSKLFVNGLLDSFVKHFDNQGKIKKIGRGLL